MKIANDSDKTVVITLPSDLRVSNQINLEGKARTFFQPFARQIIVLSAPGGPSAMTMVNAEATFLYSTKLWSVFARFYSGQIQIRHLGSNAFEAREFLEPRTQKKATDKKQSGSMPQKAVQRKRPEKEVTNRQPAPNKTMETVPNRLGESKPTAVALPERSAPLRIQFSPAEDAKVLAKMTEGERSPVADLYLRRQALYLSLSPGFETLLSLPFVRNIQPLDYQLRTVHHVLTHMRGRALLCDEVGMGKTVEAGLILTEYLLRGLVRRVLVLAPPSLVEQWQEELKSKFNLDFIAYDNPQFKAHTNPWETYPRIIASIDTAKREGKRQQVITADYDLVIVDEAHHLKNNRSLGHQLVSGLKKKYILLLTATPVENDLEELFNLITLLFPGQLETSASFKRKYITRGDPLKPKNTQQLKHLIREVMVRNRRSETAAIVGKRRADIVEIVLTAEEMAFYRRLTTFVRGHYRTGDKKPQQGVTQFLLKVLQREAGSSLPAVTATLTKLADDTAYPESLRRIFSTLARQAQSVTHQAKITALLKLLAQLEGKVIIFTGFTETQRLLVKVLRESGLPVAELHSGLRRQEKEEQVRRFAENMDILVSTETGSEGRNLQFCHQMINFDLPWNPMRIEQRIGRIHRFGQNRDVQIYNFAAAGTLEAHILEVLDAKINMFQMVVGELDMILGNLTEKRDFEDLLMDIWAGASTDDDAKTSIDELGSRLADAREHYLAVKELDDRLLGELTPED